ncbi:MAG TPA: DnaJ family domain-containing protein [Bacilli bacterium]|nr:DnaJ family domain-containing protein [Bacilli bacterium]
MSKDNSAKLLPQEVRENAAATSEKQFSTWMDKAFSDYEQSGDLEDNPYKGKPLQLDDSHHFDNYAVHTMMKGANIKPPWLELQHKIRDQIKELLILLEQDPDADLDRDIARINEQIKKYNNSVPSPILQKTRLFRDILPRQYKSWGE